jgi:hypothetical protein
MNTTGTGTEGLLIAVPVILGLIVLTMLAGGPDDFMRILNTVIVKTAETVGTWIQPLL